MKVITIGRDLGNDIVVNDGKVSRHHLQIIKEDTGIFRIVDVGSTNGTFVNERKVSGETRLSTNDIVRVGNTILPWQSYFPAVETRHATSLPSSSRWMAAGIAVAVLAAIVIASLFIFNSNKQTHVKMNEKNGVRYIPLKIPVRNVCWGKPYFSIRNLQD
jgi:hypothetical protein